MLVYNLLVAIRVLKSNVMRNFTLLLALMLFINQALYSQDDKFTVLLTPSKVKTECQIYTEYLFGKINIIESDSIQEYISTWAQRCNKIEPLLRLKIIYQIQNDIETDSLILEYYNKFESKMIDRIYDSRSDHYQEIFQNDSAYYDYVPLKGSFDSTLINAANKLLIKNNITEDEKLICLLFSNQINEYKNSIKSNKFKNSLIAKKVKELNKNYKDNDDIHFLILTGAWVPLNETKTKLGINPQIGVMMEVPYKKFHFDLGVIFRINMMSEDFRIKTQMDTLYTDSDIGAFLGGAVGYEIYSKKKWKLIPKLCIGADILNTDVLKEQSIEEDTEEYYTITTFNLGFGINLYYLVYKNHAIGIDINYHYTPYLIDRDLFSNLTSDFLTLNLIYRF